MGVKYLMSMHRSVAMLWPETHLPEMQATWPALHLSAEEDNNCSSGGGGSRSNNCSKLAHCSWYPAFLPVACLV